MSWSQKLLDAIEDGLDDVTEIIKKRDKDDMPLLRVDAALITKTDKYGKKRPLVRMEFHFYDPHDKLPNEDLRVYMDPENKNEIVKHEFLELP